MIQRLVNLLTGLPRDVLLNEFVRSLLSGYLVGAELALFLSLLEKLATVASGRTVSSWPLATLSRHFQMQWSNVFSCLGKQWFCCGRQQSHRFFSATYVFFFLLTTFMLWRPPILFYASLWKGDSFQVFKSPCIRLNSLGPKVKPASDIISEDNLNKSICFVLFLALL